MQELCGEFSGVSFSHVRCQGNRPTHLLTKYAMDIIDFSTWMEKNHCFLKQTLLYDVISIDNMQ